MDGAKVGDNPPPGENLTRRVYVYIYYWLFCVFMAICLCLSNLYV